MEPRFARGAVVGRFIVLDPIGGAGGRVVMAAFDPRLARKVALEVVRLGAAGGSAPRERRLREAQAMARLSHPEAWLERHPPKSR